jgi:hypothetical protein
MDPTLYTLSSALIKVEEKLMKIDCIPQKFFFNINLIVECSQNVLLVIFTQYFAKWGTIILQK